MNPRTTLPWVVFALFVFALGVLAAVLIPTWPPQAACAAETCKEAREWIASTITLVVILAGLFQYWQSQQWKRVEFVAAEMREFLSRQEVRLAMTMIDWASRNVNLHGSGIDAKTWPLVHRSLQSTALLPHVIKKQTGSNDLAEVADSELSAFTRDEAAIRDVFDTYLDGLERFGSFMRGGLIGERDLRPYLGYWIKDITNETADAADGEWACSLLSYIQFYGYENVQFLFAEFGYDITPAGPIYKRFLAQVADRDRAAQLQQLFERTSG